MIYLDSSASAPILPEVEADIRISLRDNIDWYNPSAIYEPAREVRRKIEHARDQVKDLINCNKEDDIIFCSGGSEANNLAIKGFMEQYENTVLITDLVSHPSIYNVSDGYYSYEHDGRKDQNCIYCRVDKYGKLDLNDLEYILSDIYIHSTILVATSWINNEIGTENNIKKIIEITHKYFGYVLVDCSQGIYHEPVDNESWDADMITFTSEKIGFTRGVGVLYKKKKLKLVPQILGGGQENGLRAGTENTTLIIPFGKHCERLKNNYDFIAMLDFELQILFIDALRAACKNICEYKINSGIDYYDWQNIGGTGNIFSVQFKGYDNQELLTMLDQYGVCCSAGSACSAGEKTPSRVLKRIGLTDEEALSTIRFSFDHTLKNKDIEEFGKILRKCLVALKKE